MSNYKLQYKIERIGSMDENHTVDGSEIRREHHRKDGAKTLVNSEISTTVPSTLSPEISEPSTLQHDFHPSIYCSKYHHFGRCWHPANITRVKQNHPLQLTCRRMDSTVGLRLQKPMGGPTVMMMVGRNLAMESPPFGWCFLNLVKTWWFQLPFPQLVSLPKFRTINSRVL